MVESNTTVSHVWKREEQCKLIILFYRKSLTDDLIIKGASSVLGFSSQYNDSTWSANQVVGPPKVFPRHGIYNKIFENKIYSFLIYICR